MLKQPYVDWARDGDGHTLRNFSRLWVASMKRRNTLLVRDWAIYYSYGRSHSLFFGAILMERGDGREGGILDGVYYFSAR